MTLYHSKMTRRMVALTALSLLLMSLLLGNLGAASVAASAVQPTSNQPAAPLTPSWSDRVDISRGSIALGPDVAMSHGEVVSNYSLGSVTVKEVFLGTSEDNGHSFPSRAFEGCNGGSTTGATTPKIAEDAQKYVYMAWQSYCFDNTRSLYFRVRDPNGTWGSVRRLTTFNTNGVSIDVGSDGVVHMIYVHVYQSGQDGQIEYIKSFDHGGTFSPAITLDGRGGWTNSTTIAVDSQNRPHVAFENGPSGYYAIYARDYINGQWSQTTTLYSGRGFWPNMAAMPNGGVGVVWQENDGSLEVYYKRWSPSGGWDPIPTNVSNTGGNSFNPAITFDLQSNAYICWAESADGLDMYCTNETSLGIFTPNYFVESSRATSMQMAMWNNNLEVVYQSDTVYGDWNIYGRWLQLSQTTPTPTRTPTVTPTATPSPTATPCADGSMFKDVCSGYWAYYYIQSLGMRHIVTGDPNGFYHPGNLVTRAEFARILVAAEAWPLVNSPTPTFSDVPTTYWAYIYIETVNAHHAMNGYPDGTFLPNNPVKRDETAKIIVVANNFPISTPPDPQHTFSDVPRTYWAFAFIETVAARNIVVGYGDGAYHPTDHIKRDQMAKFVYLSLPAITSYVPTSAHAGSGEIVTMQGRNFGDPQSISSTLTINGANVNILSWHDTVINFTVPITVPTSPSPANVVLNVDGKLSFIENNAAFTVLPPANTPTATPTLTPVGTTTATPALTPIGTITPTPTPTP